jgi:PadR family transcriptional regulator, regulatory protein PadR
MRYPSDQGMSQGSSTLPYGTLDLLVLRTLAAGARHGYGILLQIHQASNNLLRIEEGSLYPALHRLETSGLLKAEWMMSDNNRRAKYYSLTAKGRRQLAEAERNWERVAEGVSRVLRFA